MHMHSARAAHVHYAPHHEMACTIEVRIELHQCTKFGVDISKFPRTGGSLSNKD